MSNESLKFIYIQPGTLRYEATSGEVIFTGESYDFILPDDKVPAPSSVKWEGKVMTNSETNAKGDLFIEYVGKKRQVTMEWNFLTQKQYNTLLKYLGIDFNLREQQCLYYKVKAFDPSNSGYDYIADEQAEQSKMITYLEGKYVGNVTIFNSPSDDGDDGSELTVGYSDVSIVFIER